MTDTPRHLVLLGLGIVLVTTPVWAPPLDITGREYEYTATLVTVDANRVDVAGESPDVRGIADIDCLREIEPSRLCGFESRLIDAPANEAPYPGVRHVSGTPSLDAPERYVAFSGDGRVFERTTGWNESAGTYILDLERANVTRVLERASRPADQYSPAVGRAVETGSSRADEPLEDPVLVESGGRYYSVSTTGTRTFLSEKPFTERLFELVAIAMGAILLWRAGSRSANQGLDGPM